MQTTNTKELAERSRYYQGIIDVDCLNSGQHCTEDTSIKLNDRAHKYFFIASNCDKIIANKEQHAFLKMVIQNKSESAFTDTLLNLVKDAKKNIQWKRQYMDLEREKLYAYDNGIEEGAKKKAIEAAKNLLRMNVITTEQIAAATGISIEEVTVLKESL